MAVQELQAPSSSEELPRWFTPKRMLYIFTGMSVIVYLDRGVAIHPHFELIALVVNAIKELYQTLYEYSSAVQSLNCKYVLYLSHGLELRPFCLLCTVAPLNIGQHH